MKPTFNSASLVQLTANLVDMGNGKMMTALKFKFTALAVAGGASVPAEKNIGDVMIWHGRHVTGGTNFQFFSGFNTNPTTTSDYASFGAGGSAMRALGEPVYISGMRVMVADGTGPLNPNQSDWLPGIPDPALKNGYAEIFVNGGRVAQTFDLSLFDDSGTETSQLGYYGFNMPILLPDQQSISLNVTFAIATSALWNMKWQLLGVGAFA